ncbi:MAG: 50S ribosomal protein L1 [candidate division TM6 bacterium GW2011_GWF2_30_66]|nr:MAG: 50S ribosomal protein L1 [candidate division TM6 bacterium GW2011_GWF2_30_66]
MLGALIMSKRGKKYISVSQKLDKKEILGFDNALLKMKELSYAKFDETVDVHISLGIDPTQGDQAVRGSVLLPNGRGKTVKVIVFAKGDYQDKALKAGADAVGEQDLVDKIIGGWMDFDYAVATPDLMGMVGQLAKLLGPRGLLPNKKTGTVTFDVAEIVEELKRGRAFYKNDKSGLVHFSFGKASFGIDKLKENLNSFLKALISSKPSSSKGKFLKKMTISSSMGLGIPVNPDDFSR